MLKKYIANLDPNYEWNYLFFELMDMGVEYEDDWDSVGNIDYDTLDDPPDDFPQLLEDTNLQQLKWEAFRWVLQIDGDNGVVPLVTENGWDEVTQDLTEHGPYD